VGSLYLSEADRPILAGLALAAAIAFKSSPVILLLWFLAGGRWRVAVSALAGFALLTLIGWVQFGPAVTHDYFGVLTRLGTETHPDFYNQSFPALTLRVLARAGVSGADTSIASMHKLGGVLLIGFVLGLTAAAPRRDARLRVALYGLLLAVMTVASPLVWYHHNVFLILPLIVLLAQEEPPNWVFIAGIAVYFLLQSERLFEQIMPALPYEYVSPEKQLSGRQALAGLPVLVAQGLLLITLGWWAVQRVVLQPRLPHPPTQP
jgi:hypothetical protein